MKRYLKCENCGKDIEVSDYAFKKSKTKRFFCSNSCSASFNNKLRGPVTEEQKRKTSKTLLEKYLKEEKDGKFNRKTYTCIVCGKKYHFNTENSTRKVCSKECSIEYRKNTKKYLSNETKKKLSAAGKHSAEIQSKIRRSKNEIYFFELCKKRFNDVKHNEAKFNGWDADVIIEDVKYAVLWNGRWHYEKLKDKHSVEQVQNRDKIKIQEIKNCGYVPYVIKDMGKFNQKFVEEEFEKFINNIAVE